MILLTIPFWQENAAQTEQLLEFIFAQNDRMQIAGHVLLANVAGVDKEMIERIRISAELAFRGVHQFEVRALADARAPKWRAINNAFTQTATHIAANFRWPFWWMEPDCVPIRRGWLSRMVLEYGTQPKHYFGTRLKIEVAGKPEMFIMARNGVYPNNAIVDIPAAEAPFEISSAVKVFPKFTPSKLIQQAIINSPDGVATVRPDAIMLHGDKMGYLRRHFEAEFVPDEVPQPATTVIPVASEETKESPVAITAKPKKNGRPTKREIANRLAGATFQ